jgi:Fic family protein
MAQGELNYFVDEFFHTIIIGQEDLLIGLSEKIELIDMGYKKIKNDSNIETKDELNIMFILIQDNYFSLDTKGITVKDIMNVSGYSDVTVRRKLKLLEDKGLVKRIKSNPLIYVLPDGYLKS